MKKLLSMMLALVMVFAVIAFVGFSCIYNGYICQYY